MPFGIVTNTQSRRVILRGGHGHFSHALRIRDGTRDATSSPHNLTVDRTAYWTLQQFREPLPGEHPYRFVIPADSIFSKQLDKAVTDLRPKSSSNS